MSRVVVMLIWLLVFSPMALSVNTDQWLIQKLQVEDGLPSATVFSVQQDRAGFLWFGTINGVARYDGYDFKLFQHDASDSNSISNNNAGNIFIDSKNTLWIGTFGGGFNTIDLNSGQLIRYPYSSDENDLVVSQFVQTFHEDEQGNMWIGTPNGLYKHKDKVIKHYQHDESDSNSLIHSRVWDVTEDSAGNIWVATSQGLSKLKPNTDEITNHALPQDLLEDISSNELRKLHLYENQLWIGSSSALYAFDLNSLQFKTYPLRYNIKINDLMFMEHTILVATMGGLYQFDLLNKAFVKADNDNLWRTLDNNDLRQILVDQSGLLWLTTRDNGVFKIDQTGGLFSVQSKIAADSDKHELSQKIWAIDFDEHDNAYLGTSDTLYIQSPEKQITRVTTSDKDQIPGRIRALKRGKNENLWIGSSDGLFLLKKDQVVAQEVREPFDLVGIKPADIFSIEETQNGELWLSLNNLGVLHWRPAGKQARLLQKFQGMLLTDLSIGKIIEDAEQNIWMTTDLVGLIKFDVNNNNMTLFSQDYTGENSILSNRVRDIFEDEQGQLWVGTSKGVNLYHPKSNTFQTFGLTEGLIEESIYSLLKDAKDNIWVVHNFGISRINQSLNGVQNFKINSTIRKDGLNIRAASLGPNGQLYFGSINGLYSFDPNELLSCLVYQPNLMLTQVSINNVPLTTAELAANQNHYDLFHQDRVIYFKFSALDFYSPEQIQYSYRVTGINDSWHNVSHLRQIELNSLKPGKYLLEIKAKNSDCRWDEQKLEVTIEVHPLWWNIWWVRVVFLISGVLLAFLLHYLRSGIIRKRNMDLETTVENRTAELMRLNNKLKSASQTDFLTGLYNRTGFLNKFNDINANAGSSCIVLADIDHFKKINDIHGHLAGDQVLIAIAKTMRFFVQKNDFVARWGGEEFIFYFDGKTPKEIYSTIEQIRTEVQKTKIVYEESEIWVTCTFGICHIESGKGLNDCIKAADESMYKGKAKGRNITVVASDNETKQQSFE